MRSLTSRPGSTSKKTISINTDLFVPVGLSAVLGSPRAIAARLVAELCIAAHEEWTRLAQTELKSTSSAYAAGLQEPEIGDERGSITLDGMLPNLVEQGQPAYDLRAALCWNPDAKNRKPILENGFTVGWYNTVPFRHGVPGTTGREFPEMLSAYGPSGPQSLAAAHTEFSVSDRRKKARAMYNVVKSLRSSTGQIAGGTRWGDRLSESKLAQLGIRKLRDHHTTSIYTGMVKQQAGYGSDIQSQYTTFRRISTRMKSGWMHPGIQARLLHLKVAEFIGQISGKVWEQVTSGGGGA